MENLRKYQEIQPATGEFKSRSKRLAQRTCSPAEGLRRMQEEDKEFLSPFTDQKEE